ncbi:glycosyltransferase [Agromyces sp. NPDC049794]|uniref:glycosyltransferase n=1 Tax=unclassified Agromyces TaxID=2639701 RepID=UPI0033E0C760
MAGVIVHEWIEKTGGAEKVLDAMSATFPDADIRVLWSDDPTRYPDRHVQESWIGRSPLRGRKVLALPVMPAAWRGLSSARTYDWMLVSSHLFAHHARFRGANRGIPKLVYAHTPARYIWTPELDQRGDGLIARAGSRLLKPLDRRRAGEAVSVAANSEFVRDRIRDTWGLDARVIYPPVDTERIQAVGNWVERLTAEEAQTLAGLPSSFLLGASRFVPYKDLRRVIEAGEATGLPVVLAGSGPEEGALRDLASRARMEVHFIMRPCDAMLFSLYRSATAFVFPAVEDFGIMPVEAMACGTPVIAYEVGGASESVRAIQGGALVKEFDREEWRRALDEVQRVDRASLIERTSFFSTERFGQQLHRWVAQSTDLKVRAGSQHV